MRTLPLLLWITACTGPTDGDDAGTDATDDVAVAPLDDAALDGLRWERVKADVDLLASDEFGGRAPGSPGHHAARDHLVAEMSAAGLLPVGESLVVPQPLSLSRHRYALDEQGDVYSIDLDLMGYNLLGIRPGDDPEKADEMVLLVAHYDHLGVTSEGDVYNGAYDDITGACALVEIARMLDEQGITFGRSVGFLLTDAEEDGLTGAAAYVDDPLVPLPETFAVLSVDPIGRGLLPDVDPLFFIGAERSPVLSAAIERVQPFSDVTLAGLNRAMLVGYASDQDEFWEAPDPVPALWVASGGNTFYHTLRDDPDTIDYRSVDHHLRAIALLTAEIAQQDEVPEDLGAQPLSVGDLRSAVATLDVALSSNEITADERATAEGFRDTFQDGIDQDDATGSKQRLAYLSMLLFAIQELTVAHPGPIPPPLPAP